MKKSLLTAFAITLLSTHAMASPPVVAPQPTACIQSTFSSSGSAYWKTINLQLTNNCGQNVDLQNSTITFQNKSNLNTSFWGSFSPLSYPINNLQITSSSQPNGIYLESLSLQFPTYSGAVSILPAGKSITLTYGAETADYVDGSVNVYTGSVVATGQISLTNTTSKPANVTQNYAVVNLTMNGQAISSVQLPWLGTQAVTGLAAGTYAISPVTLTDTSGNQYVGTANPATVAVTTGATATSSISYKETVTQLGNINIENQALPTALAGYTGVPVVTLTRADTGSSVTTNAAWNATTPVANLASGVSYTFSTPSIVFNGSTCVAAFIPASAVANVNAPVTSLTYTCSQAAMDTVTLNITGAPTSTTGVTVTLTPNNNSTPVTQAVTLSGGKGSATTKLTDTTIYTVSTSDITGYSASYNPQPFTASANGIETITYTQNSVGGTGRIIGYMPGWIAPPTPAQLTAAGYTHILVAFGVFSTTSPGTITSAFDTISAAYIKSLQAAGIKVLLSLGGASTSIANTTIDFHQVLSSATSPAAFEAAFIDSMESLMTQYGFDGFDFDIESGLNGGGTLANPVGDIPALAYIINTMKSKHPTILLTMAPQTANVAATQSFNETWANYSSLIMQTHASLEWVGVQLYNTGCMLGIDNVCYDANATNSPNFSVAMAVDLLTNWPATINGQSTGFQPYISYLTPSQVVLGYLAPNAQGVGDGAPIIPVATIKRALQCLKTAVASSSSCDTYVPPKAYAGIGGVFEWDTYYDQSNNFGFANGLKNCVINGICT